MNPENPNGICTSNCIFKISFKFNCSLNFSIIFSIVLRDLINLKKEGVKQAIAASAGGVVASGK